MSGSFKIDQIKLYSSEVGEHHQIIDNCFCFTTEVIPEEKVLHIGNPQNRDEILKDGLLPMVGDVYQTQYEDLGKLPSGIFVSNSSKRKDRFHSGFDDDIWEIDTKMIANKWYQDIWNKRFIVTLSPIPPEAMKLVKSGTGKNEN